MTAMLVNLAIIAMVVTGLALTLNPLCILALFFLRDMTQVGIDPRMFMQMQQTDAAGHPMGFTADFGSDEDDEDNE